MTGRGARPGTNMEREGSLSVGQICRGLGGWAGGSGCLGVHLVVFFLGATVLTLLNVARSPDDLWFWRPLAWWSGLILLHAGLTLGGVTRRVRVRRADAPATDPQPAPQPFMASDGITGAPRLPSVLALVGSWVRRRAGNTTGASQDGIAPADNARVFASWVRATDAWAAAGRPAAAHGLDGDGWGTRLRDRLSSPLWAGSDRIATAGDRPGAVDSPLVTRAVDGVAPPPAIPQVAAPTSVAPSNGHVREPTRRFQGSSTAGAEVAGHEFEPSDRADWVPATVEALWATGRSHQPNGTPGSAAGTPTWTAASVTTPSCRLQDTAARSPAGQTAAASPQNGTTSGEDLVLSGPVPADPRDPSWSWLEAAAAAWLARREADVVGDPVRAAGVMSANGTADHTQHAVG